jgi:hypothetical protein
VFRQCLLLAQSATRLDLGRLQTKPTAAGIDARAEIACSTPRGFGSSEMLAVDPALFKELSTKPAAAANMPAVNE